MAGAMRKMGVYLGLVEGDDLYADEDDVYERASSRHADYSEPVRHRSEVHRSEAHVAPRVEWSDMEPVSREVGHQAEYADYDAPSYRITTLHPRTYNEARPIGEHFRSGTPVIMNLSEMDDADAKRLVDFAAGLTFGLHGRIERVTAKVFLLSPQNITVTAQDKARIAGNGFFNQS